MVGATRFRDWNAMNRIFASNAHLDERRDQRTEAYWEAIESAVIEKTPDGWWIDRDHAGFAEATKLLAVPAKNWPWAARLLASRRRDGEIGVGDTLHRYIGTVLMGGDAILKRWFTRLTGDDCGCDYRKEILNEMFPYQEWIDYLLKRREI